MRATANLTTCVLVALCVTMGLWGATAAGAAQETAKRPNVLFFLIDDMGYADLSCFGGKRTKTPNIDRLAEEGVKFTQFYVGAPICSPSRVAFTTGQYPVRWHITSFLARREADKERGIADWLDPKAPVLARTLRDAGYYTAHVGKWHMGGQRDVADAPHIETYGFDRALTTFEGLCDQRILPTFEPYDPKDPFKTMPVRMASKLPGPFREVKRHEVTGVFVDRAIEEIGLARKQGKPFYINLWPDDVHSPCQAPPELRGDGSPAANYVGVLKEMDRQVGRIFDFIKADPELRENTIIIVASDNGPEKGMGYSDDLRGSKGELFEGGIRLPLICWAPKMLAKSAAGMTNGRTVITGMDLPPTVLALTGVAKPAGVSYDGLDMSEVLLGKATAERGHPVMWVRPPDRPGPPKNPLPDLAIRDGHWKLLAWRDKGKAPLLFDVVADPNERTNVAKGHPDVTQRLTDELMAWDRKVEPTAPGK